MPMDPLHMNEGFDRFQRLLLAMHSGDELRATEAADLTGLSPETCRAMLDGLTRAGLMSNEGDGRFVRRTLDVLST
jgi:DNA-binding IclR family transcriptional regulator